MLAANFIIFSFFLYFSISFYFFFDDDDDDEGVYFLCKSFFLFLILLFLFFYIFSCFHTFALALLFFSICLLLSFSGHVNELGFCYFTSYVAKLFSFFMFSTFMFHNQFQTAQTDALMSQWPFVQMIYIHFYLLLTIRCTAVLCKQQSNRKKNRNISNKLARKSAQQQRTLLCLQSNATGSRNIMPPMFVCLFAAYGATRTEKSTLTHTYAPECLWLAHFCTPVLFIFIIFMTSLHLHSMLVVARQYRGRALWKVNRKNPFYRTPKTTTHTHEPCRVTQSGRQTPGRVFFERRKALIRGYDKTDYAARNGMQS